MSAARKLETYSLGEFLIVRKEGDASAIHMDDSKDAEQKGFEVLGNLPEAQSQLDGEELTTIRKDITAILAESGTRPNKELDKFLELPIKHAKRSPLPALPSREVNPANDNNRTLTAIEGREEGIYLTALFDWDETLYEAKSKHSIMLHDFARFLRDECNDDFIHHGGSLHHLKTLITYCDKWELQRKRIAEGYSVADIRKELNMREGEELIEYSNGIKKSGTFSANAFTGMKLKKLEEYGQKYMEFMREQKGQSGKLFDYTHKVLQLTRDHGIEPVIVTGAPDFMLPAILSMANVRFGKGMTYKVNEKGIIIGEKENFEGNMGLAEQKDEYAKELTRRDYGIAFAMGNSVGDMGLVSAAAYKDRAKEDVNGGAVLTNVSKRAEGELKRAYTRHLKGKDKDKRVRIIKGEERNRGTEAYSEKVIEAATKVIKKVFEPLHEYREGMSNPEKMEKLMNRLKERKGQDKKDPNLENIKRMRDALKVEGLNQDQITVFLLKFYPKIVVEDVMKGYMLDTRDERARNRFVDSSSELIDTTRQESLKEYMLRIGASREALVEILSKADQYNRREGLVKQKKRLTPLDMEAIHLPVDEEVSVEASTIPPASKPPIDQKG